MNNISQFHLFKDAIRAVESSKGIVGFLRHCQDTGRNRELGRILTLLKKAESEMIKLEKSITES